jgi:hypothetical protein
MNPYSDISKCGVIENYKGNDNVNRKNLSIDLVTGLADAL